MTIGSILKIIGFIFLFGVFFAYTRTQDIFLEMQEKIGIINDNFFSNMPGEIIFGFSFFIFILIFAIVISYYKN